MVGIANSRWDCYPRLCLDISKNLDQTWATQETGWLVRKLHNNEPHFAVPEVWFIRPKVWGVNMCCWSFGLYRLLTLNLTVDCFSTSPTQCSMTGMKSDGDDLWNPIIGIAQPGTASCFQARQLGPRPFQLILAGTAVVKASDEAWWTTK